MLEMAAAAAAVRGEVDEAVAVLAPTVRGELVLAAEVAVDTAVRGEVEEGEGDVPPTLDAPAVRGEVTGAARWLLAEPCDGGGSPVGRGEAGLEAGVVLVVAGRGGGLEGRLGLEAGGTGMPLLPPLLPAGREGRGEPAKLGRGEAVTEEGLGSPRCVEAEGRV